MENLTQESISWCNNCSEKKIKKKIKKDISSAVYKKWLMTDTKNYLKKKKIRRQNTKKNQNQNISEED